MRRAISKKLTWKVHRDEDKERKRKNGTSCGDNGRISETAARLLMYGNLTFGDAISLQRRCSFLLVINNDDDRLKGATVFPSQ